MNISNSKYMRDFYNSVAETYDEHTRSSVDDLTEFHRETAEVVSKFQPNKLLDLGCGTGVELSFLFEKMPNLEITGVDISEKMLKQLKNKYPDKNIKLINSSYFDVEYGENKFDCIISVMSLHHFDSDKKLSLYKKIHNALISNGKYVETDFIVSTDSEEEYYADKAQESNQKELIGYGYYDIPLSIDHQKELLKQAGFGKIILNPKVFCHNKIRTIVGCK